MSDFINMPTDQCYEKIKNQGGYLLKWMPNQTPEMCSLAVSHQGSNIKYVKKQTEEMCLRAVADNGWNIQHIKEQTLEMGLIAIKDIGYKVIEVIDPEILESKEFKILMLEHKLKEM